jgi:leucyl-tRNA synthetase
MEIKDSIFRQNEAKWQKYWAQNKIFEVSERDKNRKKYYLLVMFPYPSGKLHMGHVRNYVLGDVFARFYRMKGYQVIQPIGWDSFGLPAENAAIKNNIHPEKWTLKNISQMADQLKELGISYDWSREIATCDKRYYRWNQWFFIKMWEKKLAYRKNSLVNWCPSCQTVLANEQVNQGLCWRCDSKVETKKLEQWFLRITDYADQLLSGHEQLKNGWPEQVILMQKNWIGKSTGAEVEFSIESRDGTLKSKITIFTTRPDTLFGATFMVIAPEHGIIEQYRSSIKNLKEIEAYIKQSQQKTSIERTSADKEKTGVKVEGLYAVNPVNNSKIPIFVADYVLIDYGTGAIMAVPAHDERDWAFAKKYSVEIIEVIHSEKSDISKSAYDGEGVMVNSGNFNGMPSKAFFDEMLKWLQQKGLGKAAHNYKLKDWLISRQRYWGTPIPMIHCPKCGIVPVPENQLPVVLPENVVITGAGESPLKSVESFVNVKCPSCGGDAKRDTDTMDTFVDSSWYYARYTDPQNSTKPFDKEKADSWLPVDQYIGGIEHACMHLIYSRFWHKIMRDLGLVSSDEPFKKLLTQGMVTLGGSAMSKSKGNIVAPEEIINTYCVDTVRLFILFASPPEKQLDWSSEAVEGSWRFINRVWRLLENAETGKTASQAERSELRYMTHKTIKKVGVDIDVEHQLNTSISSVMELVNAIYQYPSRGDETAMEAVRTVVLLLSPFTPHLCEEMWEKLGNKKSVSLADWPAYEEKLLVKTEIEIPVQVNGKVRSTINISKDTSENDIRAVIVKDERLKPFMEGKDIAKLIYIDKKIVNVVLKPR